MGILQSFVPNQGDAWDFTLPFVTRYLESATRASRRSFDLELQNRSLLSLASSAVPSTARELIGDYLPSAQLLGRRTAELHVALASTSGDAAFDPEPYSRPKQRDLRDSALALLDRIFRLLRQQLRLLPRQVIRQAEQVLSSRPEIEARFRRLDDQPLTALRTRIHGDYHLGQVLVSQGDFVIIDFEGEPARSLQERRRKRSPLQDVAGMLRSFHYAAFAPLLGVGGHNLPMAEYAEAAYLWQTWVSAAFLHEYLATAGSAHFLPRDRREFALLLDVHLLEKAVYELGYELNNRPSWVGVPLSGIDDIIRHDPARLRLTA